MAAKTDYKLLLAKRRNEFARLQYPEDTARAYPNMLRSGIAAKGLNKMNMQKEDGQSQVRNFKCGLRVAPCQLTQT